LVTGPAENRRRLMDWGLFHVEPEFLQSWRRYSRALKQRNALLKSGARPSEFDGWEIELADSGEALTRSREAYLQRWQPLFAAESAILAPTVGADGLELQPGWRRDELSLADALLLARPRDLVAGFTSVGPHRADVRIDYTALPGREALSRGQAKLTALSLLLSQARLHAALANDWPVIALDDLASELHRPRWRPAATRWPVSGLKTAGSSLKANKPVGRLRGLLRRSFGRLHASIANVSRRAHARRGSP
jgi:DNA replication and repair protein RecF